MKTEYLTKRTATIRVAIACAALGWVCWSAGPICRAQSAAPELSPALQHVVALSKGGMSEEFIITYINNTGAAFTLNDDDIVNLHKQGVTENVIKTLIQTSSAAHPTPQPVATVPPAPAVPLSQPVLVSQATQPATIPSQPTSAPAPTAAPGLAYAPAPAAPTPVYAPAPAGSPGPSVATAPPLAPGAPAAGPMDGPPAGGPEVSLQYFHEQLAPFGTWVEVPGVGAAWQPSQAIIGLSPGWRPYYDNGQWVQTDNGLFWQSDYRWGDIPFHYGRWILNPAFGWVWVPDLVWGPAWVFWRHAEADGAVGWAALPPGAIFVNGAFMFNGVAVAADFNFGLNENCFVFVEGGHFHERFFRIRGREWRYHVDHERLHGFYGRSVVRNEFRRDEHGRFINNGIGRERLERMDHHIEQARFQERRPMGDREGHSPEHASHPGSGHETTKTDSHAGTGREQNTKGGPTTAMNNEHTKGPGSVTSGPGGASASGISKVYRPPTTPAAATSHASAGSSGGGTKKK